MRSARVLTKRYSLPCCLAATRGFSHLLVSSSKFTPAATASALRNALFGRSFSTRVPLPSDVSMMNGTGSCRRLDQYEDVRREVLSKYDAFIFDMDGVIWRGDKTISGAPEAIAYLKSIGKKVFFATNNSTATTDEYVAKLAKRGIPDVPKETIFCASAVAAKLLEKKGYKGKVYPVGMQALRDELKAVKGIEVIDSSQHDNRYPWPVEMCNDDIDISIGAVVMGFDKDINFYKIAYAQVILQNNPNSLFIVTNKDINFPTPGWRLPGAGTFIAALEVASGRTAEIAGKPGPYIIDHVVEEFGLPRESIMMVGDNLLTDIEFGRRHGIGSLMVLSGISTEEEARSPENAERAPDFIAPSVAVLLPPK